MKLAFLRLGGRKQAFFRDIVVCWLFFRLGRVFGFSSPVTFKFAFLRTARRYVRDDFAVEILAASKPLSQNQLQYKTEFLILQISTTHTKILFAAIYRRPPADYPLDFLSCLSTYLSHFSSVTITGDLNINVATPTAPNPAKL